MLRNAKIGDRQPGPACAAAILEGPEFRLVWCNRRGLTLLDRPYRNRHAALGRPLEELSPLIFAAKRALLREVIHEAMEHSGVDRVFSVQRGITIYRWTVHHLAPGSALALIEIQRAQA